MLFFTFPNISQTLQTQWTLLGGKLILILNSLVDLFTMNAVLLWRFNAQSYLFAFYFQYLDLYIIPNRDTFP